MNVVSAMSSRFQGWKAARSQERLRKARQLYNELTQGQARQEARERKIAEFNAKSPDERATIALGKAGISLMAQEVIGKRCTFTYAEPMLGQKTFLTTIVGINASFYDIELELAALPKGKGRRLKNDWFGGWYFRYNTSGTFLLPSESFKVEVTDLAILQ